MKLASCALSCVSCWTICWYCEMAFAKLAASMTALSQLTLRASKEIVDGLVARDLPAETAIGWVLRAADGPDLQEGMRAFRESRPPVFTDRQ